MSRSEINAFKIEIQKIIRENKFFEYSEFMAFLLDNDLFNLWKVSSNNTILKKI